MLLWVILAAMTAAAVLCVLVPLSRARTTPFESRARDAAVYRDQLAEVRRDLARGLIAPVEAEAARAEVARRLLAATAASEEGAGAGAGTWRRRAAALVGLLAVPGVGLGLYLAFGSPHLPAQPLAARLAEPADRQDVAIMIRRVETHLAAHPDDGRGWDVLANVYARLGRYEDAARAHRQTLRTLGPTAERLSVLGETLVVLAQGVVTAEAAEAFRAALLLDARDLRARYHLARATAQDGDPAAARAALEAMLAEAAPDAPWAPLVRREIEGLAAGAGPTRDEVAAAEALPAAERTTMIRGMVERLAQRLRSDGDDPDGWLRLMRAYAVLGERDKAREAAEAARRSLSHRPEAVVGIEALARELGLGS